MAFTYEYPHPAVATDIAVFTLRRGGLNVLLIERGADPRERVISVAYLALLASDELRLAADTDAAQARWFPIDALPTLAFDHAVILQRALEALSGRAGQIQPLFALLPPRFTLSQLQGAYEAVIGEEAEKRNFRKMVAALGCVRETEDFVHGAHRPARLYEPVAA